MPESDAQPPPSAPDEGPSAAAPDDDGSDEDDPERAASGSGGAEPTHARSIRPGDALLGRALALVRFLREGCPWDAAQTPETLRPYLLEEAHEVSEAILAGDREGLVDELGDLLLNLAFQIVVAEEEGEFGAEDVVRGLEEKMEARHPHVYGDAEPPDWEEMKLRHAREGKEEDGARPAEGQGAGERPAEERPEEGAEEEGLGKGDDPFAGIPPGLAPLLRALRVQDRAAGHGFEWPDPGGATSKLREELGEVERNLEAARRGDTDPGAAERDGAEGPAGSEGPTATPGAGTEHAPGRLEEEIGDLLFAAVNVARLTGVHPSVALAAATRKFERRFAELLRLADRRGVEPDDATLAELQRLWEQAKEGEEDP